MFFEVPEQDVADREYAHHDRNVKPCGLYIPHWCSSLADGPGINAIRSASRLVLHLLPDVQASRHRIFQGRPTPAFSCGRDPCASKGRDRQLQSVVVQLRSLCDRQEIGTPQYYPLRPEPCEESIPVG